MCIAGGRRWGSVGSLDGHTDAVQAQAGGVVDGMDQELDVVCADQWAVSIQFEVGVAIANNDTFNHQLQERRLFWVEVRRCHVASGNLSVKTAEIFEQLDGIELLALLEESGW